MIFNLRLAALFTLLTLIPYAILQISSWRCNFTETQQSNLRKLARLQTVLLVLGAAQYTDYYLHIGVLSRLQFLRLFPLIYLTGVLFTAFFLLSLLKTATIWPRLLCCVFIFVIGPRLISYQSLRENWIYFIVAGISMHLSLFMKQIPVKKLGIIIIVLFFPLAWCAKTVSFTSQTGFLFQPAPFLWNAVRQTKDPWVDICQKTGGLISATDLVLSPPYMNGFVYFSKRKTLVEFKSNGAHKDTYVEWLKRLTLANSGKPLQDCAGMNCLDIIKHEYNQLEPSQIDEIIRLYGVSFFVTESLKTYPFEQLYTNGKYKLYRLSLSSRVNLSENPPGSKPLHSSGGEK